MRLGSELYNSQKLQGIVEIDETYLAVLKRGTALTLAELTGRFGRSSSNVSDALTRLHAAGLVEPMGEKPRRWRARKD